jgi:imidazolonepropionase
MPCLTGIAELATCPPDGGQAQIGIIRDAALVWQNERITWVGPEHELPPPYDNEDPIDCAGKLVIPGLIDCHTHLCFGGWRGDEFSQRLAGMSYLEIAQQGGGIVSTVAATRSATAGELLEKARRALDQMFSLGITTVECKSGYGLETATELKQLEIYRQLDEQHPVDLVSTFLGAHVVPPEYRDQRGKYVDLLCDEMIPEVSRRSLAEYCDCYIDAGAFTLEEGRRILTCAQKHGLKLKIHAEQIEYTGAAALAAELGAQSAEHLERIDTDGIAALAAAGVVAVSLPLASLYLQDDFLAARALIDAGIKLAVATDFNPGSAPSCHLPLALTLACLNQNMTPAEALKGATSCAAAAIGRETDIGSLLPGYRADISIIDAPSVNHWLYRFQANACSAVIKNGHMTAVQS